MGNVIMKLKVMPSDVNVDLEAVKGEIKGDSKVEIKDFGIQPIAFGLKALIVVAVMPDEEGIGDAFVEKIKSIDGVENVEVESVELL